jgi:hypothetical protein
VDDLGRRAKSRTSPFPPGPSPFPPGPRSEPPSAWTTSEGEQKVERPLSLQFRPLSLQFAKDPGTSDVAAPMMILGRCTRRLIDISLRRVSPDPRRGAPWRTANRRIECAWRHAGRPSWLREIMALPVVCDHQCHPARRASRHAASRHPDPGKGDFQSNPMPRRKSCPRRRKQPRRPNSTRGTNPRPRHPAYLLPSRRPNLTRRDERTEALAPTEPSSDVEVLSTTEETETPSEPPCCFAAPRSRKGRLSEQPIAEAHVPSRARETAAPTEPNAETEVPSATVETAAPSEPPCRFAAPRSRNRETFRATQRDERE